MNNIPSNSNDIIDSRDIIKRIKELQSDLDGFDDKSGDEYDMLSEELAALQTLAREGEGSPNWKYGETLIRDS